MKSGIFSFEKRIGAFAALGEVLRDGAAGMAAGHAGRFAGLIETLHLSNPWFTSDNVRRAMAATGHNLTAENLRRWLSAYPRVTEEREPSTVGVVMAGNIPLVGFHDLLCVLITGNSLQAKLSSKDEHLIKAVTETLTDIEPSFASRVEITPDRLKGFDMVIATGSNNTSRYFEYYFRRVPSLIRSNRNSIAILDGTETPEELHHLGDDIFSYFGLGCRNVSKLFLPEGYDPASLLKYWHRFEILRSHGKYAANYDHNKAIMIVNREPFIDGGFILLREASSLTPPMAVVHYEFYGAGNAPEQWAESNENMIQCLAGHGRLPFGKSQQPELWDYADNIDTISFVLKKNSIR
ncbi:MAG: acyl-CoA reductase [Bacteroidales bacterium]|nr:acyl-CoA reductase [Bacteroidales bacterium]